MTKFEVFLDWIGTMKGHATNAIFILGLLAGVSWTYIGPKAADFVNEKIAEKGLASQVQMNALDSNVQILSTDVSTIREEIQDQSLSSAQTELILKRLEANQLHFQDEVRDDIKLILQSLPNSN